MIRAETQTDLIRVNDGSNGLSPTATVTQTETGATISITDVSGTTTADIANGEGAEEAMETAEDALESASSATFITNKALLMLSEIEKVVDALNWISQHGSYKQTQDTEPIAGKYYFELDNGAYIAYTPEDTDNPSSLGLYELDDVDASISRYVASHITLDNSGLLIQTDNTKSKVRISGSGVQLINNSNETIATFASAVTLGNADGVHIKLSPTNGLEFWNGAETTQANKVAYINSDTLLITRAEIATSLRIGKFLWKQQGTNRISLIYS